MLTQKDLDQIEEVIDEKLDEKLKFLPSKDEFYQKMDQIVGRLDSIDKNQAALTSLSQDHSDRLEKLETLT